MRRSLLVSPLALVLVVLAAIPAAAGGWATVGLDSTPASVVPGKPWNVNITVLQHGRTPLSGITPSVAITSGTVTREFTANADQEAGRVPRLGRLPDGRSLVLHGGRRVHGTGSHLPGGDDRRRARRGPARGRCR